MRLSLPGAILILAFVWNSTCFGAGDYYPLHCRYTTRDFSGELRMNGVGKFWLTVEAGGVKTVCPLAPRWRSERQPGGPTTTSIRFAEGMNCDQTLPAPVGAEVSRRMELLVTGEDFKVFAVEQERPAPCVKIRFEEKEFYRILNRVTRSRR